MQLILDKFEPSNKWEKATTGSKTGYSNTKF